MPFLEGDEPSGRIGSGLPPATLVVAPDKILQLKRRFEDRREKVFAFMLGEAENLLVVPPPGADPCSEAGVEALGQNGQAAMDALQGFVSELTDAIDALEQAAHLYGLVEESNTTAFRLEPL